GESLKDVIKEPCPCTDMVGERPAPPGELSMNSLRDIMNLAARPGVLSFAIGLPAAELFPRERLADAAARVIRTDPSSLQYSIPHEPLKRQIVEMMAWRGVRCTEEQIFLTSGAQQGMDL